MEIQKATSSLKDLQTLPISLEVDYQALAIEIFRKLRQEKPQRELSQLLGFSFNQVGKWEVGSTQIKWSDFLNTCRVLDIPMERIFRTFFWMTDPQFDEKTSLQAIDRNINPLTMTDKNVKLKLRKWIEGQSQPDLAEVLKIFGQKTSTLLGWLSQFLNVKEISILKNHYEVFEELIEVVMQNPLVVYVNAALQLEEYRQKPYHDEKLLAENSACSVATLREVLQLLLDHQLIRFDGKKYHHSPFDFSFASLTNSKIRSLTYFSTKLAAERYPRYPIPVDSQKIKNLSRSSVRVTALSKDAALKISELLARVHTEIGEIVSKDHGPKDNVQVILMHSFCSNFNSPEDELRHLAPQLLDQKLN